MLANNQIKVLNSLRRDPSPSHGGGALLNQSHQTRERYQLEQTAAQISMQMRNVANGKTIDRMQISKPRGIVGDERRR